MLADTAVRCCSKTKINIVAVTPNPKFLQVSDKKVAVAPPATSGGAT